MASDIMLQAFYKRGIYVAVPSPSDGSSTAWWWDHLAEQADALATAGFTAVWLPPVTKAAQGASAAALGYSVFDDYDLGSKVQKGTRATRYGHREQLQRCAAMLRCRGLDLVLDFQANHRKGGGGPDELTFQYLGAEGALAGGRFPKTGLSFHSRYPAAPIPAGFTPAVPQDPNVPLGVYELQQGSPEYFGPDLAPIRAVPAGHVRDGLVGAATWTCAALGATALRVDHVKGISVDFINDLLATLRPTVDFAVGEYFSGDVGEVLRWQDRVPACSVFDFPLWGRLLQMCNHPADFDMGSLDHAGVAGARPFRSVTFVENHDTESRPDIIKEHIVASKVLAYAYILTSEGYPCVFYKDYSEDTGCLGMRPYIDNLMWIRHRLATGPTVQRWKDLGLFIFERLAGPHLVVGLNKDSSAERTATVATGFAPGSVLHDYTGHGGPITVATDGRATIVVPRNQGLGLGYVAYSVEGIEDSATVSSSRTTQVFDGAADLDIAPAGDAAFVTAATVWVEGGSPIDAQLSVDVAPWSATTSITMIVEDAHSTIAQFVYTATDMPPKNVAITAGAEGWHRIRVRTAGAGNIRTSYRLTVTYAVPAVAAPNLTWP